MNLLKRIVAEKKAAVIALAVALIANAAVYGLLVRPLEIKSANAVQRAAAAKLAAQAAERDFAAAQALVSGKTRADEELSTFYEKVVPADLTSARKMTYAKLPALAQKANVKYEQGRFEVDQQTVKDSRLGHLKIRMIFEGDYEGIRRFIYALETAPQFVIIDDMTLAQTDPTKPQTLTLVLSTYYRLSGHAS